MSEHPSPLAQEPMSETRALVSAASTVVIVLCLAALVAGALGAVWPLGDSLAVGRLAVAAMLVFGAALALVAGARRRAALALALAALAAASCWALPKAPGANGGLTLYQKNVLYHGLAPGALAADIRATAADVVTLQEIRPANHPLRRLLEPDFPHQAWCPFVGAGGTVVLSRWAFVSDAICGNGYTAAEVAHPDGPLWVVSLHLFWPAPYRQIAQVAEIAPELGALPGRKIIAGDFNMVAWAHAPRRLRRATQTTWQGGPRGTLPMARHAGLGESVWPALPIDHIFAPAGWGMVQHTRPRLGSDHLGVVARLAPR